MGQVYQQGSTQAEGDSLRVIFGVPCFLELMKDFNVRSLMFSNSYCLVFLLFWVIVHTQDTKAWLLVGDAAARLPWGPKDFIALCSAAADKGYLVHHLFQSFS